MKLPAISDIEMKRYDKLEVHGVMGAPFGMRPQGFMVVKNARKYKTKKVINVGGKEVAFRSSATVPRLYRAKFKRDIFKDLAKLESSYKGSKEEGEEFAIDDLEIFENVAYIMAYHADNTIPDNIDDWLDQFEMFSIYEVLPEILALWGTNLITDIDAKKNLNAQAVR